MALHGELNRTHKQAHAFDTKAASERQKCNTEMHNDGFEHACRTGNSSPWPPHATHAWRLQAAQVFH